MEVTDIYDIEPAIPAFAIYYHGKILWIVWNLLPFI